MATAENRVATLQTGLRTPTNDAKFTNYAYWISGANSKNSALQQYDLLRTGYVRLFVLQLPKFVDTLLPEESKKFKHMLEFGNVGIDGIQGFSVETTQATGGFAGTSVELPTISKDDTSSVTIKVYETQGSLIRTYIDFWITGTFDPYTGLSHYHGARDIEEVPIEFSQANHTMEILVVAMDPTGDKAEYSCLLTNLFPKSSNHDHFNFDPGQHELVQLSLEFTCNKYMGSQINYIGQEALNQFKILRNFLNTYSGYSISNFQPGSGQTYFNNASSIDEWQTQKASTWFGSGATGEINPLSSYMDKAVLPSTN